MRLEAVLFRAVISVTDAAMAALPPRAPDSDKSPAYSDAIESAVTSLSEAQKQVHAERETVTRAIQSLKGTTKP